MVIYSGVDYGKILEEAIIWDGGNNDFSFYVPDLQFTVADVLRPGHEVLFHPGEANFKMADVIIINKVGPGTEEAVEEILENCEKYNPTAKIILAASPCTIENGEELAGKKVLIVEDGPTLTHMDIWILELDMLLGTFEKFTQLTQVLPAMGYGKIQMKELEDTINNTDCDAVVIGTPIDLSKHINIEKECFRVEYNLEEIDSSVFDVLEEVIIPLL